MPRLAPSACSSFGACRALPLTNFGTVAFSSATATAAGHAGTISDPAWAATILAWYAEPTPAVLPDVGGGTPNAWGVRDLHGLVWEWIEDFSAALVSGNDRGDSRDMFCGGGSSRASDPTAYAAFMRMAYRSALRASYTTPNLGFRCAYDIVERP